MKPKAWRECWLVIFDYVRLNQQFPEQYPLHSNFWGYRNLSGQRIPYKCFAERILAAGPGPSAREVQFAIGGAIWGDAEEWLWRRVAYIRGEIYRRSERYRDEP